MAGDDITKQLIARAGSSVGIAPSTTVLGQTLPSDKVLLSRERGKNATTTQLLKDLEWTNKAIEKAQKENNSGNLAKYSLDKQSIVAKLNAEGYKGANSLTYAEARTLPSQAWDEKQLREFVNKGIAYKIKGFQPGMGMPEIQGAWDSLVQQAITLSSGKATGGKTWTPWDVLESYNKKGTLGTTTIDGWIYDLASGERIGYKGPLTRTKTQKDLNLSSAGDVQVIATQALRDALGREPTAKELAQFKATINNQESANPAVTTTTTQLKPNLETGELEEVSSSSQTTGGLSDAAKVAAVAAEVKDTPEHEKYASSNYFSDLLALMGGA